MVPRILTRDCLSRRDRNNRIDGFRYRLSTTQVYYMRPLISAPQVWISSTSALYISSSLPGSPLMCCTC
ncbi:hypothetical protein PAXRUDRAFT_611603 [Paxillus rubicundulus Ve08.2h10]|uniref:Uncharacterized protein n=1 Tax=Paxillus rubicundulus Ve08.2h10 TaxID=930991 RepID=A0A0D0DKT1_9AGAM|nr:hypothetical protein PAXRUDRAFT_611603 [Paxillus rubicundulus Ve08.2h10]